MVNVFLFDGPAGALALFPELGDLQICPLVGGGNTSVDGNGFILQVEALYRDGSFLILF